jgi:tetratricopeptide (TPR) repeat protein
MTRILAIAALLLGAVPSAALANEGGGGLISLDKSIVIQMINFGLLLFETGRTEEATQQFQRAIELAPENARMYQNLAMVLSSEGRNDDALAVYSQILRLNPGDADARRRAAELRQALGR